MVFARAQRVLSLSSLWDGVETFDTIAKRERDKIRERRRPPPRQRKDATARLALFREKRARAILLTTTMMRPFLRKTTALSFREEGHLRVRLVMSPLFFALELEAKREEIRDKKLEFH